MPGDSACTTANPRGTQVDSYRVLIVGLVLKAVQKGANGRDAGGNAELVVDAPVAVLVGGARVVRAVLEDDRHLQAVA